MNTRATSRRGRVFVARGLWCAAALSAAGCQDAIDRWTGGQGGPTRTITIAMIAKSSANPVFLAAKAGAEAAAKDLSEKRKGLTVRVDWRTPDLEDPAAQAARIRAAVADGAHALLVACSDEQTLAAAIDEAVAKGVPVMTFDSDAPRSKRLAFYGADDLAVGEAVIGELAALLPGGGPIAVLAGNPDAPNLKARVEGVRKAAARHPKLKIAGVFHHAETPEAAVAKVLEVNAANPGLAGWAMVGSWPLFSTALLDRIDPARLKIVAVDALPVQFPYVERGVVPVLLAQPTFKWGKVGVETLVDRLTQAKAKAAAPIPPMKLIRVTKDNLGGWARQLKAWGYADVPERYLTFTADQAQAKAR